ncbi:hypothetical protein [Clostridium sp. C2-6-12]|uniref:hypothetical protein n=1 Tax=Clostridium sp. C2-6-12 TaxID=2698832 RepID=UPI00136CC9EC|nr:hypothetical protein [Clostridium sp. C2-6-12]
MKKLIVILMAIFTTLTLLSCQEQGAYPKYGKDTVAYFGDARYVVLVGYKGDSKYWDFYDQKDNKGRIDIIDNYKDIKPFAYTIGEKGYTKVNYENGDLKQAEDISEFDDCDKEIFKQLEDEKDKVKK